MKESSGINKYIQKYWELNVPGSVLKIRKSNILAAMEMNESMSDQYLSGLIDELVKKCKDITNPRACYALLNNLSFDLSNGSLFVGEYCFDLGKMVASFLRKSSLIAVFICTCGDKVEKYSKSLIEKGNALEGFIVDLIGSEIAEDIADYIHEKIRADLLEFNLNITNRYSPGYCNWSVTDQQKLFEVMDGCTCGVKLTPSSLMVPIKSVSGIIGIGSNVKQVAYKCKLCSDEKCILRQRG